MAQLPPEVLGKEPRGGRGSVVECLLSRGPAFCPRCCKGVGFPELATFFLLTSGLCPWGEEIVSACQLEGKGRSRERMTLLSGKGLSGRGHVPKQ